MSALLVGSLTVALGGCASSSGGSPGGSGSSGSSGSASSSGSTGSSGSGGSSGSSSSGGSSGSSGSGGDDSGDIDATTPDSSVSSGDDSGTSVDASSDGALIAPPVYDSGPCPSGNPICTATTWAQISAAHTVPTWVKNTKLGIGMHFMIAAVPADHNEWFYQHEYCNGSFSTWTDTYFPKTSPMGGPWGYKDFIPAFTCSQWSKTAAAGAATSAASWAALFKAGGATYVNATAMHHDRFAMWDSAEPASVGGAGTWNAAKMGPMRDVVGELGTAVKAQGLKYGVNNHMMYGYSFAYCGTGTTAGNVGPGTSTAISDLYDPRFASLYGPPNPGCGVTAKDGQCNPDKAFCDDWLYRANELVDKYQLDDEWFDWDGATVAGSPCMIDKLAFVLHYYQTAAARGQQVQIMGKGGVFPAVNGAEAANVCLPDSQASDPSPVPTTPWMEDVPVSSAGSWCYIDANGGAPNSVPMAYISTTEAVNKLKDINGKGGIMMLNISPMPDGTIPQGQIDIINALGKSLGAQ